MHKDNVIKDIVCEETPNCTALEFYTCLLCMHLSTHMFVVYVRALQGFVMYVYTYTAPYMCVWHSIYTPQNSSRHSHARTHTHSLTHTRTHTAEYATHTHTHTAQIGGRTHVAEPEESLLSLRSISCSCFSLRALKVSTYSMCSRVDQKFSIT